MQSLKIHLPSSIFLEPFETVKVMQSIICNGVLVILFTFVENAFTRQFFADPVECTRKWDVCTASSYQHRFYWTREFVGPAQLLSIGQSSFYPR
jgi:hypothetical protein